MGYIKRVFYLADYAKELRYYSVADLLKNMFENSVGKAISLIRTYGFRFAFYNILRGTSNTLGNMGVMLYLAYGVYGGRFTVGDFTALVSGSGQLSSQILSFLSTFPQIYEHSLYIQHYREFMDYQPQIIQDENKAVVPDAFEIDIRAVAFSYPNTSKDVLRNINIRIGQRERIAFVGLNGSGKTTLVKLITRLYDPTEGALFINGKAYGNYQLSGLHDKIGVMFQDYHHFALSIAENILMREVAPQEREVDEVVVWDALEACGLADKVRALPDGIHTKLTREFSNEGIFLSGGELQRLALARIYAKQCSLVILDEPSSALDPVAEHELFQAMLRTGEDKTVIMISHRLANIKDADKIYLFENGTVVEAGTHHELIQLDGKYAMMFQLQAEQYTSKKGMEHRS